MVSYMRNIYKNKSSQFTSKPLIIKGLIFLQPDLDIKSLYKMQIPNFAHDDFLRTMFKFTQA